MLKITSFTTESLTEGCVTDRPHPRFAYTLESDRQNVTIKNASITVRDWTADAAEQTGIAYGGKKLTPYTEYTASLSVETTDGDTATAQTTFKTGKMNDPWAGKWISDPDYHFTEKKVSPVPMVFRRKITLKSKVAHAEIFATAMGIYTLAIDNMRVGNRYFAPGFTSYKTNLEYQVYNVTSYLSEKTETVLTATVAGGWAVGSFVFTRVNRQAADRQALLLELRITYEDGSQEVIGSDESFEVTEEGPVRMADLYDGETYDATMEKGTGWHKAAEEKLRVSPAVRADYGSPVIRHEHMRPQEFTEHGDSVIYNFAQNFAGITELSVHGAEAGDTITIRHAELLNRDGSLNVAFLRSAKATFTCVLNEGDQVLAPDFTYMGFQYAEVSAVRDGKPLGADWIRDHVQLSAWALYSDLTVSGDFSCSNEMLNRLQKNITWGARSNFVDIPTDCPQRDERMGWTGDINVFSPTACWNFDMKRFLEKWLIDVKAEQLPSGGIPNTVPVNGYGFPATMPEMAIDWWGDACVSVPWNLYRAYGDEEVLREMYPTMKKYVDACSFWARLGSFGKKRYIWDTPAVFHFGDWVAPDVPKMSQWQGRAKWTATASIVRTGRIVADVAAILGNKEDERHYRDLSEKTADAYATVLMDGNGKLNPEFQTGYVLPIYFDMLHGKAKENAVNNLAALVEKNDFKIGTGFPGTPYILFALADNGRADVAFKMLMNTKCPGWLYEVKMGATTIWERWDGLDENGDCPIGDDGTDIMISYNHYASGAVGDFLYRRIAGIEMTSAGYRTFQIKPLVGGGLTGASGTVDTPFGRITSQWEINETEDGKRQFTEVFDVPVGTVCELTLPDGTVSRYGSGHYVAACLL